MIQTSEVIYRHWTYSLIINFKIYLTNKLFREKEKEARRKEMENLLNTKRSSSRIETLKKTQEEKDRLLAIQVLLLLFEVQVSSRDRHSCNALLLNPF